MVFYRMRLSYPVKYHFHQDIKKIHMSKPIKHCFLIEIFLFENTYFLSKLHSFKDKIVCIGLTVFVRLGLLFAKIGCDIKKQVCDYFGR